MMNEEGVFPRLLELIQTMEEGDLSLHRMLLDLLYEMSRIQRLRIEDLRRTFSFSRTILAHMLTAKKYKSRTVSSRICYR